LWARDKTPLFFLKEGKKEKGGVEKRNIQKGIPGMGSLLVPKKGVGSEVVPR